MASDDDIKEFPDISHKLSAPKKLSAYEKEKQEKEAKRLREKLENEEALKEFEEEHAAGDRDQVRPRSFEPHQTFGGHGGRYSRFGGPPTGPRSGPGSLGSLPGPPPPMGLKRKRENLQAREAEDARRDHGWFADDDVKNDVQVRLTSETSRDQAPRATLKLSSMPPIITKEEVIALLKPHVEVYSVEITPPHPAAIVRASTAIATLGTETSSSTIDATVSALRERYLGCGYFLSISRHLSSAALHSSAQTGMAAFEEPFGAQRPKEPSMRSNLRNAPPPSSYGTRNQAPAVSEKIVQVSTSIDTRILRAIHVVAERLRSLPDKDQILSCEAMLMQDERVKHDPDFAWLYDSRSRAGVYYRYILWRNAPIHDQSAAEEGERLFPEVPIRWLPPQPKLKFMDLTCIGDIVDHPDYDSDEEDEDDNVEKRRFNSGVKEAEDVILSDEIHHLNPVQQARFAWMLSRLPHSNTLLRNIDVAHITNFAIAHAPVGATQIVDFLLINLDMPLCLKKNYQASSEDGTSEDDRDDETFAGDDDVTGQSKRDNDDSSAPKYVGLLIINDILFNTATAGAKGAWKYRQIFEAGFLARKNFERLGRLHKELNWGKIRAEQWKHKIIFILDLWEKHNLFRSEVHEELKSSFLKQYTEVNERIKSEDTPGGGGELDVRSSLLIGAPTGRFKKITGKVSSGEDAAMPTHPSTSTLPSEAGTTDHEMQGVRERTEYSASVSMAGAQDPANRRSVDAMEGVVMSRPAKTLDKETEQSAKKGFSISMKSARSSEIGTDSSATAGEPRRRMKAEDMFADSDED